MPNDNCDREWGDYAECEIVFQVSCCLPPGIPHEDRICSVLTCREDGEWSWIEACERHEGFSIAPLCREHGEYAAEALDAIEEIVAMAGLLQ